jgi:hypothetical protein
LPYLAGGVILDALMNLLDVQFGGGAQGVLDQLTAEQE